MLADMEGDRVTPAAGPILSFRPGPPPAPVGGVRIVVLDTSWTPGPGDGDHGVVGLRDSAARVLADWDLIADTAARLDAWAAASGVVAALTIEGSSFWFNARVRHWAWFQERVLWLALVDDQVRAASPSAIECEPGCDEALVAVAALIAAREGIPCVDLASPQVVTASPIVVGSGRPSPATNPRSRTLQRLVRRLWSASPPTERARRRGIIEDRLEALAAEPGRLLVVLEHARQRVETSAGTRFMNAYLGPMVDRLRGTRLDPIEVDIRARLDDDATWGRLMAVGSERLLPADVTWTATTNDDPAAPGARADVVADAIATCGVPVVVLGVDLGPSLASQVADLARVSYAGHIRSVSRLRSLIGRLQPAAILLADEYQRHDWLTAARLEGVPTVAVQHGMIYRWHNGYMHRDRPDQLRLASRTYVFGEWERRLLTETSIYHEDEVRVSGSPRLDLVPHGVPDRDGVRAELGVAPGDRLVVISGTWGPIYRRFHYPIALAKLLDRPLPRVHLVVKLHPGELDEGPYRAVVEGVAAARGFEPPPITIVQSVDLYRLLRAADAHVGVHSTVLTEAAVTGTLNLLADTLAASDLLGYVEAGVAIPVRDGGDLLAALDAGPSGAATPEARQAFLDDHFRPGSASERIAADLLAWPA